MMLCIKYGFRECKIVKLFRRKLINYKEDVNSEDVNSEDLNMERLAFNLFVSFWQASSLTYKCYILLYVKIAYNRSNLSDGTMIVFKLWSGK
jgi:hypothetical protein